VDVLFRSVNVLLDFENCESTACNLQSVKVSVCFSQYVNVLLEPAVCEYSVWNFHSVGVSS
jgi:hypothetical protein